MQLTALAIGILEHRLPMRCSSFLLHQPNELQSSRVIHASRY
jgi:hypothetical protein